MQFGHIEIFVKDPLASMAFYNEVLGFEVTDVQHEHFVWMQSGGTTILLRPGTTASEVATYQNAPSGFVIYTSELDDMADRLRTRGLIFRGTDGSDRCLTFTDPDGHWFQLVDPNEH